MPSSNRRRQTIPVVLATTLASATIGLVAAGPAQAATCSDVQLIFARGTGEAAGLGSAGKPLSTSLKSKLSGKTVSASAVNYAAAADQSSAGPGATDMTNQLTTAAAQCPGTQFVLGGYSQGASVTDIALGISTTLGKGKSIPTNLAGRVAAVVVFGNPLGISRKTIETSSQLYGAKAKSFCNTGDPVCGNGNNILAHLAYPTDGSVTTAATFAAGKIAKTTTSKAPANSKPAGASSGSTTTAQTPASTWQDALTKWRSLLHSVLAM
jgi:cutinase